MSNSRPHTAVAGMQWGDEGKGKIVDLLAGDFDLVVRYNGGANAGHTVVVGAERYALHLVPCGVLHAGKVGVIANGVVVDPDVLLDEIRMLRSRNVPVGENLRISDRAHVVMPYHKTEDGLAEAAMAVYAGEDRTIGTTGRGIGPCYRDKAARFTAVRVADLLEPEHLARRLELITHVKNATLGALALAAGTQYEAVDAASLANTCVAWGESLAPFVTDTSSMLQTALRDGRRLLFEGANGFLLDVDHGTYPFVTSSNSSALGLYPGAGVGGSVVGELIGVVKAYTTRVGGGPCPTEQDNEIGRRLRDRGNEYGTTTGRPRRCGWLDLFALRYAVRTVGATSLAVTLLDVLAGFDTLRVCVGYERDGRQVDDFPATATALEAAVPVYHDLPGFADEISQVTRYEDLPETAKAYLRFIADFVGVPVRIVGVGPGRAQTLFADG